MEKEIDKKLQARNIKPTAMRELILEILIQEKAAISLPELEKKFDRVDKATLYRTLKTFEEKKLVHSIDDGTGSIKYALCFEKCTCEADDLHVHFHCTKCNNTYCLHELTIPAIRLPKYFELESVEMVVQGRCINCIN